MKNPVSKRNRPMFYLLFGLIVLMYPFEKASARTFRINAPQNMEVRASYDFLDGMNLETKVTHVTDATTTIPSEINIFATANNMTSLAAHGLKIAYLGVASTRTGITNPDEKAAVDWLFNTFQNVEYISFQDIVDGATLDYSVIWWHLDASKDLPGIALNSTVVNSLKNYYAQGGDFLLTSFASQYVEALGIVPAGEGPNNVFGDFLPGGFVDANNSWGISFKTREDHPIFQGLDTYEPGKAYFLEKGTYRLNHVGWWSLADWTEYADGQDWRNQTGGINLASEAWDNTLDGRVAIAEFKNDPSDGNVVVIAFGAYDWHNETKDGVPSQPNGFIDNIQLLTKNSIEYLYIDPDFYYVNGNWKPNLPDDSGNPITSSDNISIIEGTANLVKDAQMNNLTVHFGATLNIKGTLTVNGDIMNNGSLLFVNNATHLGQLGDMTGSTITGSGNVTIQRYIPKRDVYEKRTHGAYRYITSAVTTTTSIHANWQEGGINNNGFGMLITGTNGSTKGFDETPANDASMFIWNNVDQAFNEVTNTDEDGLVAGVPYAAYVWGNRSVDIVSGGNDPEATDVILRATGSLKIGPQPNVVPFSPVAGDFNFVGNPYQAIVDMGSVLKGNTTNLNPNHYYVWDPNLGDHGAYVTVDPEDGSKMPSDSKANQYLQPGQAVFIRTLNDGAASISFQESDKNITADPTDVFRPQNTATIELQLFRQSFFVNGGPVADAFKVYFSKDGNNTVLPNDAAKMYNPDENVGLVNHGDLLIIANRNLPKDGETLQIFNNNYRAKKYTYKVEAHLPEGTKAFLHDSYLDVETRLPVDGEMIINFNVDETIPASMDKNRFSLVFSKKPLEVVGDLNMAALSIYPNPAQNGKFFIPNPGISGDVQIMVYNLLGQQVYHHISKIGADKRIAIKAHNLSDGVYVVKMAYGGKTLTGKVVVQND